MRIRKLAPSGRVEGRWLCHLEDGTILRLGESEVVAFGLGTGKELSGAELSALTEAARAAQVREKAGDRAALRAMHVYAENRRAKAQADALRRGDFDGFLALVRASGASSAMFLQNVIPTGQTARQELMVTIALCQALLGGRGAVRVHGGGFGGTAQAFVPLELVEQFRQETEAALGKGACHVVTIRPAGGVRIG